MGRDGTSTANNSTTSDTTTTTDTAQTAVPGAEPPKVKSWGEEWVDGDKYALRVTLKFNERTTAAVVKHTLEKNTVLTRVSGDAGETVTVKVAGPKGAVGALDAGTSVLVAHDHKLVDDHVVGTLASPQGPKFLDGLDLSTSPDMSNDKLVSRRFEYTVHGTRGAATVNIPDRLYDYYKARKRTLNFGAYGSDTYDDLYLKRLGEGIKQFGDRAGFDDGELATHVIRLVQNMKYTRDKAGTGFNEYPKYPVETLYDQGGDCEDTAILVVALLEQLGIDAILLLMPDAHHAAAAVNIDAAGKSYQFEGKTYYYLETTAPAYVGETPANIDITKGRTFFRPMRDHPVLVYNAQTQVRGPTARVGGYVANVGDATAKSPRVRIGFQNKEGREVVHKIADVGDVDAGTQSKYQVELEPPRDEALRLRTAVLLNDGVHDTATSEYQTPE